MSDSPCHGCTKRVVGCHGKCPEYKKWRAKLDAERAKEAEAKSNYFPYAIIRKENAELRRYYHKKSPSK